MIPFRASTSLHLLVATCGFFVACSSALAPGPEASADAIVATELQGVPFPADNVPNPAKVELGRLLFWDPILSGAKDVACASCHDPRSPTAMGARSRSAPEASTRSAPR
jgi:cytochrome c peroxidase